MTCPRSKVLAIAALSGMVGCSQEPEVRRPTAARAQELVAALDAAFNRASTSEYFRWFDPLPQQGGSFAQMSQLVDHEGRLRLSTELVEFVEFGEFGLARVLSTLSRTQSGEQGSKDLEQHNYLAFRDTSEGPQVLLYEDVDPGAAAHLAKPHTGVYACPPCNFKIGTDELMDWLVIPSPRRISGCVEMVSFRRIAEDIQMTLSIHRNDKHLDAMALLTELTSHPTGPDIVDRGDITTWVPPHYDETPEGMQGARRELVLASGQRDHLHVMTRRTPDAPAHDEEICYLLTVRGSAQAHADHRDEIDAWLRSFQLIDTEASSHASGKGSATAHGGGVTDPTGNYSNAKHGLNFSGPEGWHIAHQADRCLLAVTFTCPQDRGVLHVAAHETLPGTLEEQKSGAVDLVMAELKSAGLEILEDTGWQAQDGPGEAELFREIRSRDPEAPPEQHRRDRILMFDDLWVLVDGMLRVEAAGEAFVDLASSVRR